MRFGLMREGEDVDHGGDYLMQGLIDRLLEKLDETLGQVVRKAHDIDTHTESEALPSVRDCSSQDDESS